MRSQFKGRKNTKNRLTSWFLVFIFRRETSPIWCWPNANLSSFYQHPAPALLNFTMLANFLNNALNIVAKGALLQFAANKVNRSLLICDCKSKSGGTNFP